MQQLSGLDAAFLYLETPEMPMHIGSLSIYDQSSAPNGKVGFKDILSYFGARMHTARVFRQKVLQVPLGLDHPYWIDDKNFDLEFHIRHIALPAPGDWRQLCIQAARIHARPLDLSRPLWEAWVIEGLDNVDGVPPGSFALLTKFHHAAIDGVSGAEIAAAFHDLTPDGQPRPVSATPNPREEDPGFLSLTARSAWRTVRQPFGLAKLVGSNVPAVMKLGRGLLGGDLSVNMDLPRTRFNANVSSHRVFDGRSFSLDEVRAIKSRYDGTTVNDVMVTICGGALRHYLEAKNELPEESLLAMAPVSVRSCDQKRSAGNQVATMRLPVGSDIKSPLRRLAQVHKDSMQAKKLTATMGSTLAVEAAQFLPSTTSHLLAQAYGRYRLAERLPPVFNTVITNIPGARQPLYSMGSRLVSTFGLGPIAHGVGLFQPILSYLDTITIGAVSCREMMPDPSFYAECLQESFDELKHAALKTGGTPAAPAATKKPAAKKKKKAPVRKKARISES